MRAGARRPGPAGITVLACRKRRRTENRGSSDLQPRRTTPRRTVHPQTTKKVRNCQLNRPIGGKKRAGAGQGAGTITHDRTGLAEVTGSKESTRQRAQRIRKLSIRVHASVQAVIIIITDSPSRVCAETRTKLQLGTSCETRRKYAKVTFWKSSEKYVSSFCGARRGNFLSKRGKRN